MNMNNIEQEKIFAEEQAHLQDTFDRLKKMEKDLEEKKNTLNLPKSRGRKAGYP